MLNLRRNLTLCCIAFFYSTCSLQHREAVFHQIIYLLLEHSVPEIRVEQLDTLFDNYVLLDARENKEFQVSHIKNARWIGYKTFSAKRVKDISKTTKIIVYCSVGYRSEKICERLQGMGYQDVSNLYGGIFDWMNKDKTVYNTDNQPTEQVHAYNKNWGHWLQRGKKVY